MNLSVHDAVLDILDHLFSKCDSVKFIPEKNIICRFAKRQDLFPVNIRTVGKCKQ